MVMFSAIAIPLGTTTALGQELSPSAIFLAGTSFTGTSPSLITVGTPNHRVNLPSPRYFFTLQLPADSPEAIGKVIIIPQASSNPIAFNLQRTTAFQGTQAQRGKPMAVTALQEQDGGIAIAFDPPVPPGTIFTLSLQAVQNPAQSGIYQFRVRAFPVGVNPTGIDLGVGRLSFFGPG